VGTNCCATPCHPAQPSGLNRGAAFPVLIQCWTTSRLCARLATVNNSTDGAQDLLRLHGLRVTAQRMAVLRAVKSQPHATADDLADQVRAIIGSISRQAVYDTLSVLVDRNLVRRIQPAGSAARYEDRVGDNHHHLICRACGSTFDVDCAAGAVPCLIADDDHGFEIDEAEVIYWGHCAPCRAHARVPQPSPIHLAPRLAIHPPSPSHPQVPRSARSSND
jgi:Fe2+ or Zn2+ uptake regulation protein